MCAGAKWLQKSPIFSRFLLEQHDTLVFGSEMSDAQLQSLFEANGFLLLWPLEKTSEPLVASIVQGMDFCCF